MRGVKSQDRREKEWEDADRMTLGATFEAAWTQLGCSLDEAWLLTARV